jgi:hypothetical protein
VFSKADKLILNLKVLSGLWPLTAFVFGVCFLEVTLIHSSPELFFGASAQKGRVPDPEKIWVCALPLTQPWGKRRKYKIDGLLRPPWGEERDEASSLAY